ncbi:uncharacterized protein LOC123219986 [Mangifera indica]|uniref:uncharacterized protein LOC123219986 n=1 Tax=Mangifera indica TaxID=29780 RepID=UPI001CFBEDFA|nr:uncharacterized protein LOC123219986 [Mangifera indica]
MEGVGSRLGRASARYGPTQTVFNGPVRKWKKKWVHVSSASQSNGHSTTTTTNNGSPLLLCKWTPIPSNPSEKGGALPEEPPKRRFRYTPIVVIEDRKKAIEEKDDDETKETETNVFTNWSSSKRNELTVDKALMKETQDSNTSHLDLGLCLKGHGDDQ